MAYVAGNIRISNAMVFARALNTTKMTDDQMDAIVTSGILPTSGWVQLKTLGGASWEKTRETVPVESDQLGVEDMYINAEPAMVNIKLANAGFEDLTEIACIEPTDTGTALYVAGKDNRGILMKAYGLQFIIYDRSLDPNNNTDIPDVTVDPQTIVSFCAVQAGNIVALRDGNQDVKDLTFEELPSDSSGSSYGYRDAIGTFTAEI